LAKEENKPLREMADKVTKNSTQQIPIFHGVNSSYIKCLYRDNHLYHMCLKKSFWSKYQLCKLVCKHH
jgi:hypothetical protein